MVENWSEVVMVAVPQKSRDRSVDCLKERGHCISRTLFMNCHNFGSANGFGLHVGRFTVCAAI